MFLYDISSYIFHGISYQMSLYLNCILPIFHEIHLAISPLMNRISSFPAWDIRSFVRGYTLFIIECLMGYPLFLLVSFIAILACNPAFQFVNFLCYAMWLIIPNLRITRKYSGHTFIYWTHRYGLNNGGSAVLGPTISFVVVTSRQGVGCSSARCTTRCFWLYRVIYSSEKYLPNISQEKLMNISR